MKKNRYKIFVCAVTFIATVLIFVLFPAKADDQDNLKIEFIKDLIQLSLIVIIGGILIHEYNSGRDQGKKQNELKKELYLAMVNSYFKVKKVRRVLEAGVKNKNQPANRKMLYPIYQAQMYDLNDAQLEYEFHGKQLAFFVEANGFRNKKIGHQLKGNTSHMQHYLNDIIEIYQKSEPDTSEINISEIKKLNDFIFDTRVFKNKFSDYHSNNIELFLSEILNIKQIHSKTNDKKTDS